MDYYDAVDVVGHYDEVVHFDGWEAVEHGLPDSMDHLSCIGQLRLSIRQIAEQAESFLGDDGYEVRTGSGIVVCFEAD